MKIDSTESALAHVRNYLTSIVTTPFFVVVDGSAEYSDINAGLDSFARICTSNYCANDDAYPDFDSLCENLSSVKESSLLLGFGESVSLGVNENVIGRLKDLSLSAKVVVICRGIRAAVTRLCEEDKKFDSRRVSFLNAGIPYEIVRIHPSLSFSAIDGFKKLLFQLENGASGKLFIKTALDIRNIRELHTAYDAILEVEPSLSETRACLPDKLWAEYHSDRNLEGFDLFHWRSFLKLKRESSNDVYLKYIAETSPNYAVYKKRIYNALLDYNSSNNRFRELYNARKSLLKNVKDSDIAEYISETKVKDNERIYYLTDNSAAERQSIIECLNGMVNIPDALKDIYPALYEYLQNFLFNGDKGKLLTDYFAEYKRLKLTNRLTPEFHEQVLKLAVDGSRPYNSLQTRGAVLDSLGKGNAALYWIDALGAEYLGYIQSRANSLGLKIMVHVVRANLPTITSLNSDFYESWVGDKAQTKELDKIKHEGERDFNYQTIKTPVHLAEELHVIDRALEWAKTKLTGKNADKVIVTSDHGASRLAVISEQECKWKMASKGKHSGRCCPCTEADVKSEYATQENGYWVLANYDRFKGGRKASVEVHGGATLEEVVIPIIEITLFDNKVEVSNTTPVTTASFKKNAEIVLFSKNALKSVSVRVNGKQYLSDSIGNNKHKIGFHDIKRAGKYIADVFEGDNLIGQVAFEVQSESGKTKDSDWF